MRRIVVLFLGLLLAGCRNSGGPDSATQLKEILGVAEWRGEIPEPNVVERGQFQDLDLEQLSLGGSRAYLLKNKSEAAPAPGVVIVHGHCSKASDFLGISNSKKIRPVGLELAKAGFVVLAPEIPHDCRNMQEETRTALLLLMDGKTLMGKRVEEILRWAYYLRRRPDVERMNTGILGWSMGGQIALYAAAVDPDIWASYISNAFESYRWLSQSPLQSPDNYIPGIWKFGDKDRTAALIAPRPVLIEHGENDPTAPITAVEEIAHQLQDAYEKAGAHDRLMFVKHRKAHAFSGTDAVAWFSRWLKK